MTTAAFLIHDSAAGRHPAGQVERVALPVSQALDGFVRLLVGQQGAAGVICGWLGSASWAAQAGLQDFRVNPSRRQLAGCYFV
jgi:hypothetical protein